MKTRIIIEVETKIKPFLFDINDDKPENCSERIDRDFHDTVHNYLEELISGEGISFEEEIFESWIDDGAFLPEDVQQFSDLGDIKIVIRQEEL